MQSTTLLILILTCVAIINAQVPGFGKCPNFKVMQNFDANRYLGLWYEVRKYPFIFTIGGRCITATYGLNPDQTVSVLNKQIRNGMENTIKGSARSIIPGVGSLAVTFPNVPVQTQGSNYEILYTDYDELAVVFSCSSFFSLFNAKSVWILTRQRHPPQSVIDKAYEVLHANGISTTFISETDHKNCPEEVAFNQIENFRY